MNCSDWDEVRSEGRRAIAGQRRESGQPRRRALEERGKQRHCGRTAQASDGCEQKARVRGDTRPINNTGSIAIKRRDRHYATWNWPGAGTEIANRKTPECCGEVLTLDSRARNSSTGGRRFWTLQARLGAGNRRECDGGNCHPHPGAFVRESKTSKHPYHILPQIAGLAVGGGGGIWRCRPSEANSENYRLPRRRRIRRNWRIEVPVGGIRIAIIIFIRVFDLAMLGFDGVENARPVNQRQTKNHGSKSPTMEKPDLLFSIFRFRRATARRTGSSKPKGPESP